MGDQPRDGNGHYISMRDYIDMRFDEAQRALDAANRDMERRLESMNEFRAQLTTQAGTFMSEDEYRLRHEALTERHDSDCRSINKRIDNLTWKIVAISSTTTLLVGIVLVLLGEAVKNSI